MKHIGFTGTRQGCTPLQMLSLQCLIAELNERALFRGEIAVAHHGDCVGADAEFHAISQTAPTPWRTVGHLPTESLHRAFCDFDETREPLPYMRRNREIVRAADVMIACPPTQHELQYGGTWRTVGLTRKAGKPLAIVLPDGTVQRERWP